ncbi:o-methyltransferase family 3 [Moniliophthora roreri MCA 2997]|uniref:O-methyltransferase family 3 n=1 Tax=Moniliophthora roreri (strain MCA 2997) TaxID=1381753 RepID=V2XA64_MONRO|nr:o-methyltransferase family 3 [Moniliophthora roreri MCA 2997]
MATGTNSTRGDVLLTSTLVREDKFHQSFLIKPDPVLENAASRSLENGLPDIALSALQGKFIYLLAKAIGAKRILEVGTLGGYSAIWLARALPDDGELITLEKEEKHAKIAREHLDYAGADVSSRVKILVGAAADTMPTLTTDPAPFDMVFIDADKSAFVAYYMEAKRLVRSGGVIVIDNMMFQGEVSNLSNTHPVYVKIRELLKVLKDDDEVEATTVGTAGIKGFDGFLFARKK